MRNFLFSCLGGVFIFSAFLFSCKHDSADESCNETRFDLIEELVSFNENLDFELSTRLSPQNSSNPDLIHDCRGWVTAGADLGGAAAGFLNGLGFGKWLGPKGVLIAGGALALIDGVTASVLAYKGMGFQVTNPNSHFSNDVTVIIDRMKTDPEWAYYQFLKHCPTYLEDMRKNYQTNISFPEEYLHAELIGPAHNAFIEAIFEGKFDMNDNIDWSSVSLNPDEMAVMDFIGSSHELQAARELCFKALHMSIDEIKGIDVKKYATNSQVFDDHYIVADIMELFIDVYHKYPDNETTDYIINKYIYIIEKNGKLTSGEKGALYSSLSVAAYSPRQWSHIYEAQ